MNPATSDSVDAAALAQKALRADDPAELRRILAANPALKAKINDPVGDFDSPLIAHVRSAAMLDALLAAGADVNARSSWWAGGFGLLDSAEPELAAYAVARGATVTVHAAARLGWLAKLQELVSQDPDLVQARGGDGQTPLHFASTIEVADYLLAQGAQIDARDVDHESTPAQYLLQQHPEVVRFLITRGCQTDLLMGAALGDMALAQKHLAADPASIRMRVSDEYFPMVGNGKGGTIYQWQLGWYVSAVQVARGYGHDELFRFLTDCSPLDERLLNACWLHDDAVVRSLLQQDPALASSLQPAGRRQLAHAARNNDTAAARLLLEAGLPLDTFSQHHATPLHWAAWHGNAELVRLLLPHGPPLEDTANDFKSTPLGWAAHGSENGWHRQTGDYAATVEALLKAGAILPQEIGGTEEVKAILRKYAAR